MKLYKRIVDLTMMDWEEATPAEIMASHPKCGECEHVMVFTDKPVCRHYSAKMRMQRVDPEKDYCRHWEGKQ
jgi:hypothetical protein